MYNVDYYFGSTENTYDKVLDGLYTTEVHSFKTSSLTGSPSKSLITRRVIKSISELEREKFKYLHPKRIGGQAGRTCTSLAPD